MRSKALECASPGESVEVGALWLGRWYRIDLVPTLRLRGGGPVLAAARVMPAGHPGSISEAAVSNQRANNNASEPISRGAREHVYCTFFSIVYRSMGCIFFCIR